MTQDKRDLLEVLKAELAFLEKGGYRHTARAEWRPQFMFQDSPTCLNFDPTKPLQPCRDCVIRRLVPMKDTDRNIPCRFIQLNEQGGTIDSFYRAGSLEELENAVTAWLRKMISRLAEEKAESSETPSVHVRARFVPQ